MLRGDTEETEKKMRKEQNFRREPVTPRREVKDSYFLSSKATDEGK